MPDQLRRRDTSRPHANQQLAFTQLRFREAGGDKGGPWPVPFTLIAFINHLRGIASLGTMLTEPPPRRRRLTPAQTIVCWRPIMGRLSIHPLVGSVPEL
jgi:hypothetical protein